MVECLCFLSSSIFTCTGPGYSGNRGNGASWVTDWELRSLTLTSTGVFFSHPFLVSRGGSSLFVLPFLSPPPFTHTHPDSWNPTRSSWTLTRCLRVHRNCVIDRSFVETSTPPHCWVCTKTVISCCCAAANWMVREKPEIGIKKEVQRVIRYSGDQCLQCFNLIEVMRLLNVFKGWDVNGIFTFNLL